LLENTKVVDIVKWVATVIQLIGYGLTGMGLYPINVGFFIVGIFLWFTVGYMWKDKAIMVVHIGALISILSGFILGDN
jgi:hypothetical protein